MVGKDPVAVRPPTFAERMGKYAGKPYSPNGVGPASYGCFGLVYAYLADIGAWRPSECWTISGTWTIRNYAELIEKDIAQAEAVMLAVFGAIGTSVIPSRRIAGDILVVRHQMGNLFPAICTGNGHALASFLRAGVRSFSLDERNTALIARRVR